MFSVIGSCVGRRATGVVRQTVHHNKPKLVFLVGQQQQQQRCKSTQAREHGRFYSSAEAALELEDPEFDNHFCLILGPPGGGKGTISKKMLADFPKFHHVSTGDILRQHVRYETPLGAKAKSFMDRGALVPDDLMIELVMEDAAPYIDNGESLLLDGFPRTIDQAIALEMVTHIDMVINLNVPTETIVDRIADRWIHPASGRVYSYSYHPPKVEGLDDETGEPLVQRDDDKPEAVRKRLAAYDAITAPLVEYYEKQGVVKTFSGTQSDVIYPNVKDWLKEKNC